MAHAALAERLREKGLRVTQQRVAVLEYLVSTPTHPTAEEIGAAVNRGTPTTSRASVYNVLHSLKEAGLIEELVFDDAVARYDANLDAHHHFVCTRCGAVHDVPWDALPPVPKRRLASGHVVESVDVTLRGTCPGCAART
jgi:Fur family transcriptional regulator, peroxide stress response regulator